MPTVDDQIAEWKHAYQVLGVPQHASARVIKAAYRKLVKRWHPDLYTPGTSQHADATQMSMLINEAYSEIAHAPLRYTSSSSGIGRTPRPQPQTPSGPTINIQINPFKPPRVDRLEFWVRFVCGALFGMFSGVTWVLSEVSATSMGYALIAGFRRPRPYRRLWPGCGSIRGQVLVFGLKVLLIAREAERAQ
jgi:hypothetical protein